MSKNDVQYEKIVLVLYGGKKSPDRPVYSHCFIGSGSKPAQEKVWLGKLISLI